MKYGFWYWLLLEKPWWWSATFFLLLWVAITATLGLIGEVMFG